MNLDRISIRGCYMFFYLFFPAWKNKGKVFEKGISSTAILQKRLV